VDGRGKPSYMYLVFVPYNPVSDSQSRHFFKAFEFIDLLIPEFRNLILRSFRG